MKYVVGYISSQYIVEICCVKLFMAFLLFQMFALKLIFFPCLCACILKMKRLTNMCMCMTLTKCLCTEWLWRSDPVLLEEIYAFHYRYGFSLTIHRMCTWYKFSQKVNISNIWRNLTPWNLLNSRDWNLYWITLCIVKLILVKWIIYIMIKSSNNNVLNSCVLS